MAILNDHGHSEKIQIRIKGVEADYERMVRRNAPKFRLVRNVETFSPIKGKTIDVPVNISDFDMQNVTRHNSPPIIATLHDRRNVRQS